MDLYNDILSALVDKTEDVNLAKKQFGIINGAISVFACMYTWPEQFCVTEDEHELLLRILETPWECTEVPDCMPRLAFDTVSVIVENNRGRGLSVEELMLSGVNDTYVNSMRRRYEELHARLMSNRRDFDNKWTGPIEGEDDDI